MGTCKMSGKPEEMGGGGGNLRWTIIPYHPEELTIFLVASYYGNQDKPQRCGATWIVCRLYFTFDLMDLLTTVHYIVGYI